MKENESRKRRCRRAEPRPRGEAFRARGRVQLSGRTKPVKTFPFFLSKISFLSRAPTTGRWNVGTDRPRLRDRQDVPRPASMRLRVPQNLVRAHRSGSHHPTYASGRASPTVPSWSPPEWAEAGECHPLEPGNPPRRGWARLGRPLRTRSHSRSRFLPLFRHRKGVVSCGCGS